MRVLINASAASEGGALTIINEYVKSLPSSEDDYIVLSPIEPRVNAKNIKWIQVNTDGVITYLFSLVFVYYYYFFLKCEKIISFNNVNMLFPVRNRVTYFHNFLILKPSGFKNYLLNFTLRCLFQRSVKYIFQTEYVKNSFIDNLGFCPEYKVCWPGVSLGCIKEYSSSLTENRSSVKRLVWPCSNIFLTHKNFSLLIKIAAANPSIVFIVPSNPGNKCYPENINFVGKLSRDDLLRSVAKSDGVLVTSKYETVCIPIFEALFLGKIAIVLKRPYITGLKEMFHDLNGILEFDSELDFYQITQNINMDVKDESFDFVKTGHWSF